MRVSTSCCCFEFNQHPHHPVAVVERGTEAVQTTKLQVRHIRQERLLGVVSGVRVARGTRRHGGFVREPGRPHRSKAPRA